MNILSVFFRITNMAINLTIKKLLFHLSNNLNFLQLNAILIREKRKTLKNKLWFVQLKANFLR